MNVLVNCEICLIDSRPVGGKCTDQNCCRAYCEDCFKKLMHSNHGNCPMCRNNSLSENYGDLEELRDIYVDINTIVYVQGKGKKVTGKTKIEEEVISSKRRSTRSEMNLKNLPMNNILSYTRRDL